MPNQNNILKYLFPVLLLCSGSLQAGIKEKVWSKHSPVKSFEKYNIIKTHDSFNESSKCSIKGGNYLVSILPEEEDIELFSGDKWKVRYDNGPIESIDKDEVWGYSRYIIPRSKWSLHRRIRLRKNRYNKSYSYSADYLLYPSEVKNLLRSYKQCLNSIK